MQSHPVALHTSKLLLEKLSSERLRSAIGSKFNVSSLLDYIQICTDELMCVLREYNRLELEHGVDIDSN